MKILFSPCHYVFDPNSGSESSWSYNIADQVASQLPESVVVTGFQKKSVTGQVEHPKNYQVIELQPTKNIVDMSFQNALRFNWEYFQATKQILKEENHKENLVILKNPEKKEFESEVEPLKTNSLEKFEIIHHLLPFAIGGTYNLGAILGLFKNRKFIIGPLQTPLDYKDIDVNPSDFRGGKVEFSLASFLIKIIVKLLRPILQYLSHLTLQKADKIVVINQATKNLLLSQKIPENKIHIIPPGLDLTKFNFAPKIPFLVNIKSRKPIFKILSISYLLRRKGVDLLIEAVSELQKLELPVQIELNILGDGPQMKNLQKIARQLNLKNVNFVGFIDNSKVTNFYQEADLFVSMSRGESWGQMYLEAMACGLPIITTENVGSQEIIDNGETGFLVPQESVEKLVEKIIWLIENPAKKLEIIHNARRKMEEKYDWQKITQKYLELYRQVLTKK